MYTSVIACFLFGECMQSSSFLLLHFFLTVSDYVSSKSMCGHPEIVLIAMSYTSV
uniref:Uncharacterized protein n=1 Tax=Arion vulgaris TaxID=1028688 RepID=A0A0B6Y7U1_9EUPU